MPIDPTEKAVKAATTELAKQHKSNLKLAKERVRQAVDERKAAGNKAEAKLLKEFGAEILGAFA